jgi:hypothetical protein
VKSLCPFQEQYRRAIESSFPEITVVLGTHQEHITPEEFRARVKRLFNQKRKTMVDMIQNKDIE